ncbi:hypothetical protein HK100_000974 [Physocladia obscura]|uniref:Uncharacterized protein n=1 Tax=Physocladia obscura TaxID=109957 RepID=A0AAD5SXW5_9FUNG|nr:hypothetical protein HK100_000974 [Physocladia obscura]
MSSSATTTTTTTTTPILSNTTAYTAITSATAAAADPGLLRATISPVETRTTESINPDNVPNSAPAEESSATIVSNDTLITSRPAGAVSGIESLPKKAATLSPTATIRWTKTKSAQASLISSSVSVFVSTDSASGVNFPASASSSSVSSLPAMAPYILGVGAVAAALLAVAAFLAVRRSRNKARTQTHQHLPVTSYRRHYLFMSDSSLALGSSGSASTSIQQRVSRKAKKLADTFKTVSRDTHLVHQIRTGLLTHSDSADYLADDEVNLNNKGQSSISSIPTTPSTPTQSRSALLPVVFSAGGPNYWPFYESSSLQIRESPIPDTLTQIHDNQNTDINASDDNSDSENGLLPRKLSFELLGGSTAKEISSSSYYGHGPNRLPHLISVSSSNHAITTANINANIMQYNLTIVEDFSAQIVVAAPMPEFGGTQSVIKTLPSSQFLVQIDSVAAETQSLRGDILD